jgi:hypothetical protein
MNAGSGLNESVAAGLDHRIARSDLAYRQSFRAGGRFFTSL